MVPLTVITWLSQTSCGLHHASLRHAVRNGTEEMSSSAGLSSPVHCRTLRSLNFFRNSRGATARSRGVCWLQCARLMPSAPRLHTPHQTSLSGTSQSNSLRARRREADKSFFNVSKKHSPRPSPCLHGTYRGSSRGAPPGPDQLLITHNGQHTPRCTPPIPELRSLPLRGLYRLSLNPPSRDSHSPLPHHCFHVSQNANEFREHTPWQPLQ